jgi:hypothetical protein
MGLMPIKKCSRCGRIRHVTAFITDSELCRECRETPSPDQARVDPTKGAAQSASNSSTGTHIILSDAGCGEAGNELESERQVMLATDRVVAKRLFLDACIFCRQHLKRQHAMIAANSGLTLTSEYFWSVVWLTLHVQAVITRDAAMSELRRYASEGVDLDSLVERFASKGISRGDVVESIRQKFE